MHKLILPLALELGLRIILGSVFIYASWDKIIHPQAFAQAITNYQILPGFLINPLALWLPWIEIIAGICLIIGRFKLGACTVLTVLLVGFSGALGLSLFRGIDINCGCFSTNSQGPSNLLADMLRDLVLLVMGIGLWIRLALGQPKKA